MKYVLTRKDFLETGIFGILLDETGKQVAVTLEHAYDSGLGNGTYIPKVAAGIYKCIRHQPNRLPYETYELQDVPNFEGKPVTGILIHKGNFDKDSEGCILLGSFRQDDEILESKVAFDAFMEVTKDEDSLTLIIEEEK